MVKSATRLYHGFYFGKSSPGRAGYAAHCVDPRAIPLRGKVISVPRSGVLEVEQRNKFSIGETLEVLSPYFEKTRRFTVRFIYDMNGTEQESAPHPQQHVRDQLSVCAAARTIFCADRMKRGRL